ncbi:hypothetical protein TNCT_8021 [Trichonephila clavata]|uniref:Uncharacterized protein n=1 Tax=Trichonephila clavata TaxID=2740835 RepID=A0A8X6I134_TRICU|nr:hypothetical protein TNCT_8021 [Trichonephila clavata]
MYTRRQSSGKRGIEQPKYPTLSKPPNQVESCGRLLSDDKHRASGTFTSRKWRKWNILNPCSLEKRAVIRNNGWKSGIEFRF